MRDSKQARLDLLDTLAAADLVQLVARHRIQRLQGLMAGFTMKAEAGTALARRVLKKELQSVVSAYFGGDWLAVLDYLQASPHPDEEILTALPEPRLYVGTAAQTADMAAEVGIAEGEVQAMLAAFLGGGSSVSPVQERAAALHDWWAGFDHAHAVQSRGMPSLWGLVDQDLMVLSRTERGFTPRLYRQRLPSEVLELVGRLWETVTLQRHPGSIVSNPRPHQTMAEALGPAVEFWHGVGLTAWFVCEGPYSRTTLDQVDRYYSRPLAALRAAGCPVDAAFFRELRAAEQSLGPEKEITESQDSTVETSHGQVTITSSVSRSSRREGFERVRDLITRYRRAWAEQHFGAFVEHRWRSELEEVAHQYHRVVAAKGRPPTLPQFARFATTAANHWTGTVRIICTGAPVDVSAVLLGRNGKVRNDHDLVFYNHPHHDGVRVGGDTVTADLNLIPDDITSIAVIVSIDLEAQPTTVFDQHTQWHADITQSSGTQLAFVPGPFSSGETVTIAVELYRRTNSWKVRGVGQGYNTGLAGLATDYGINVEA
ncbi:TerD family protein [Streptomyces sp. URMC 129]|uniref:TerD family protein n=1 Tax=Streptomyces sp. URMC 129 TaxID=3423407 RepID=UPI003F1B4A88